MRIKICGITNETDARQAATLGADAIGLNFYAQSPRFIDPEQAAGIVRSLPPFVEPVAVFVNQSFPEIAQALAALSIIRTIQWHGDTPPLVEESPFRLIPAFAVRDRLSLEAITDYLNRCRTIGKLPAGILVDAHVQGRYGGTGQTAPWDLLADFDPGVPLILAGGLTPGNVAEAVRIVRPYAVDVASGVEMSPGRKDPQKMRSFIDNARNAAAG